MTNSILLKLVVRNSGATYNQFYNAQVGLAVSSILLTIFIGKNNKNNILLTI
jgi:hypothetical protein